MVKPPPPIHLLSIFLLISRCFIFPQTFLKPTAVYWLSVSGVSVRRWSKRGAMRKVRVSRCGAFGSFGCSRLQRGSSGQSPLPQVSDIAGRQ